MCSIIVSHSDGLDASNAEGHLISIKKNSICIEKTPPNKLVRLPKLSQLLYHEDFSKFNFIIYLKSRNIYQFGLFIVSHCTCINVFLCDALFLPAFVRYESQQNRLEIRSASVFCFGIYIFTWMRLFLTIKIQCVRF